MLGLQLREEFRGKRLKGTTVDFKNQSGTGALDVTAADFLKITYPSHDLLKTIEATGPGHSRPVVLLGARGQGKSHLMAALYHLCNDPDAGSARLSEWAAHFKNPQIVDLKLRNDCFVIAESLHLQRYKYLWDILFQLHPKGQWYEAKWSGMGDKKTDVPSYDLMMEMFTDQPTVLILDEFQTWYEGLTNTKQYPWRNWAFNFIQILSEIAQKDPDKLVLVVSVREGNSDAYQQIRRVNPVDVDFKGPYAKRDRQRLLLYRIFENRMQVPTSPEANGVFLVSVSDNGELLCFTTDRDTSIESENIDLLGLDHPHVVQFMQRFRGLPDDQIGIRVRSDEGRTGVLSIWHVTTQGERGETRNHMLTLAVDDEGQRIPSWEKQADRLFQLEPASENSQPQIDLLTEILEPMIQRELVHRGFLAENRGYDARLVVWVEVV